MSRSAQLPGARIECGQTMAEEDQIAGYAAVVTSNHSSTVRAVAESVPGP